MKITISSALKDGPILLQTEEANEISKSSRSRTRKLKRQQRARRHAAGLGEGGEGITNLQFRVGLGSRSEEGGNISEEGDSSSGKGGS